MEINIILKYLNSKTPLNLILVLAIFTQCYIQDVNAVSLNNLLDLFKFNSYGSITKYQANFITFYQTFFVILTCDFILTFFISNHF